MTLEEARRIVAGKDDADTPKTLEALAVVLRFHGIADKRYIGIAELIESAAQLEPKGTE